MDMGIKGRKAIVCAASKGLGKGCAMALAGEGVDLVINARTKSELEATAEEIRKKHGVKVTAVAVDVTTEDGRKQVLAACPEPDIVVNNAGGPPPGNFRDWNRDAWIKAIDANMLTPIEFIKATVDGMMKRGFGRIVNITSSSVKAPIDILGLSNGARSGLTGFVAGVCAHDDPPRRHDQRPAARPVRHRSPARHRQGAGGERRPQLRGGVCGGRQGPSRRPLRHGRGVRHDVRVPVQRACRLHDRPEHPDGRRPVPGHVLSCFGRIRSRAPNVTARTLGRKRPVREIARAADSVVGATQGRRACRSGTSSCSGRPAAAGVCRCRPDSPPARRCPRCGRSAGPCRPRPGAPAGAPAGCPRRRGRGPSPVRSAGPGRPAGGPAAPGSGGSARPSSTGSDPAAARCRTMWSAMASAARSPRWFSGRSWSSSAGWPQADFAWRRRRMIFTRRLRKSFGNSCLVNCHDTVMLRRYRSCE